LSASIELARIGRDCLSLELTELSIDDQALTTFYALGREPSLLILDNVRSEEAVRPWLPLARMPCHVVVTTVLDSWDRSWRVMGVEPLPDPVSLDLVEKLAGVEMAGRHGARLVAFAGGLPIQLVPRCLTLAKDVRRRGDDVIAALTDNTLESFGGVYERLEPEARLVLHAAARFNTQRIIAEELKSLLAKGTGWDAHEVARHLDACLDVQLLQGEAELRMHQLFATFVREKPPADEIGGLFKDVVKAQASRLVELAEAVAAEPNRADLAVTLMAFPVDQASWAPANVELSLGESMTIGKALSETGQFTTARPWFERAVAEAEKGDVQGHVDHESLWISLHQVGFCLSETGEFAAARPCYERAVAEIEKGDVHGRVNHDGLGISLHQVALCLSRTGEFAAARTWYERAVSAKEKGDVHGRIDHASLGSSLHQIGFCLISTGELAAARPWYERAVTEKETGDVHGRVDHRSLGISLHQVGHCLSGTGEFASARLWFERSVSEKEKGDVHGRIDHESLGSSLHMIGHSLSSTGEFAAARPWYERAIAAKDKGDIHGRIDHQSLGSSLHSVGSCLSNTDGLAAARPWFERAVAEKEKGDVHGRINQDSLGASREALKACN
jgi:tetratricopeptide (TPR) repeat protein